MEQTPPPFDPNHVAIPEQPAGFNLPEAVKADNQGDIFAEDMQKLPPVDDQVAYEFELTDRFGKEHGEAAAQMLTYNLNWLKRYAGISLPSLIIEDPDFGDPNINSEGEMQFDYPNSPYVNLIVVPGEQNAVRGEMPEPTKEMIAEIYHLVDAQVLRNTLAEGEAYATVIRKGQYLGEDIFFEEKHRKGNVADGSEDTFVWSILSRDMAKLAVDELSDSEVRAYMQATGVKEYTTVLQLVQEGVLTRQNYKDQINLFKQ